MSEYYLSTQLRRQASAFQRGLASVVEPRWLRMFAAEEIRLLLSGSMAIDLDDMSRHTNYASGYTKDHELIRWMWEVLAEFSSDEMGQLLRFCTSCSRAPLLGFQFLTPQLCIQVRASELEQTRACTDAVACCSLSLLDGHSLVRVSSVLLSVSMWTHSNRICPQPPLA
jgi:ubiquitin-protein ligase E3 C